MYNAIVGNPVPYRIGRKVLLVGYVSMSEWTVYGELLKQDNVAALIELIYCSLHRGAPAMTRRRVRWLVRMHSKRLLTLVELICELSLPKIKAKSAAILDPDSEDAERNLKIVYRLLSRMHGWSPVVIGDMSPAQIYLYLIGGPDATGTMKMSSAEYQSFRAQRGL